MSVLKKKSKANLNTNSHVKSFNRNHFNFFMYDKTQDLTIKPVIGERKSTLKNAVLFTLFSGFVVILFFTLRDFMAADLWSDLAGINTPLNSEDPIFVNDYIMQHPRMKSHFLSRIKILSSFCM